MITFAIILIGTCAFCAITLLYLLWWSSSKKKTKPVKKHNEKFSKDMRETQVLNESMIDTEKTFVMEEQELDKIFNADRKDSR